ncbi:MAG: phenylalanine--tRNA ligase subunit alpha [Candidatus Omnitrophota bacterium]
MSFDWTTIEQEAQKEINQASSAEAIEALRIKYLGRQGLLAGITGSISSLSAQERPEFGKKANYLKNKLTRLFEERVSQLKEKEAHGLETFDITLPGEPIPQTGSLHPITQTIQEITAIFSKLGFVTKEGPEVENEYNNFSGLNIPLDHPSRDAFDTFYLKSPQSTVHSPQSVDKRYGLSTMDYRLLLRSHTSPVQIRVMKEHKPPLAVIVPGKVYRPDAVDASHSFVFHQIEGFLVDQEVSFADLKGTLTAFAQRLFGEKIQMRFRPHFFPFTEPSAEVDISCILCSRKPRADSREPKRCSVCGGKGWLEILGCGMIHPNVFANVGYPKDKYSGFAFGMGIERIAMLKYGINDIRLFYENDLRFLRQF